MRCFFYKWTPKAASSQKAQNRVIVPLVLTLLAGRALMMTEGGLVLALSHPMALELSAGLSAS
jgi:hypothetical protein